MDCMVVDVESVGRSYGREVLGKPGHYAPEGVHLAIASLRVQSCKVLLVSTRSTLQEDSFGNGVEVVIASNSDIMVAKQANIWKCPILSKTNFKELTKGSKLSNV